MLCVSLLYNGFALRSKDPLPIRGHDARSTAITECTTLARPPNVPVHENWDVSLPASIFPDTVAMLNWVQHIAEQVSHMAVIRVVDKFPCALWGFCRQWMWAQLHISLQAERYQPHSSSAK